MTKAHIIPKTKLSLTGPASAAKTSRPDPVLAASFVGSGKTYDENIADLLESLNRGVARLQAKQAATALKRATTKTPTF